MTGNMAEIGLCQNGGQCLHVGLVEMFVINFPFQKASAYFSVHIFLLFCIFFRNQSLIYQSLYVFGGVTEWFGWW